MTDKFVVKLERTRSQVTAVEYVKTKNELVLDQARDKEVALSSVREWDLYEICRLPLSELTCMWTPFAVLSPSSPMARSPFGISIRRPFTPSGLASSPQMEIALRSLARGGETSPP